MAQLLPSYKLKFVHKDDYEAIWDDVKDYLEAGVSMCRSLEMNQLTRLLDEEKAALWVVEDGQIHGAAVTGVTKIEDGYMMEVLAMGGEKMEHWLDEILPVFEYDAKRMGCTYIQVTGRQGWKKMLKSFGYNHTSVILGKDL